MSLFTDMILESKVRKDRYEKGKFYNAEVNGDPTPYSIVNAWDNYSDTKIRLYQIQQLKKLEAGSGIYSGQYKEVSEFINNANRCLGELEGSQEEGISRIFERAFNALNALIFSSENSITKGSFYTDIKGKEHSSSEKLKQDFDQNLIELQNCLIKLENINQGDNKIPVYILKDIQKLLRISKTGKFYIASGKTLRDYIEKKWKFAEDLTEAAINTNPKLKALRLDKLFADGQYSITDVFAFNQDTLGTANLGNGIQMKIKSDGGKKVRTKTAYTIQDFLNIYDGLKTKETIHISLEDEEVLRQASAFAAQTKSGIKQQSILSEAKRNSILLGGGGLEFTDTPLWNLFNSYHFYFSKGQNDSKESQVLNNYFNYALGTYIDRTVLTKNQIYATASGFVTASEWMEKTNKMLKVNSAITKISKTLPLEKVPYNFHSPT